MGPAGGAREVWVKWIPPEPLITAPVTGSVMFLEIPILIIEHFPSENYK